MCGRFYVDEGTAREIERVIRETDLRMQKMHTGDICPSQPAGILICHSREKDLPAADSVTGKTPAFELEEMHWGFPQYQRKGLLINARAETALERKMFRGSVLCRRCIIPAKHFYEWDAHKNKAAFFMEGKQTLYMAGFYNRFQDDKRFIILTTQANVSVSIVHNRMPLVLDKNELEDWIYDDKFTEYALHKTPPKLCREQEYEQQSLFLT